MAALMSLGALAIDGMLPALDEIALSFGIEDPNRRQLVVGIYLLASGFGCLVPGAFADRFGRRPVIFVALGFYILTSLLCAAAPSYDALLGLRALQGFATAGLGVVPVAVIRDRFEGDAMARLLSTIFIVFMVVPVLAPSFGQGVLIFAEWPWVFVGMALTAAPASRAACTAETPGSAIAGMPASEINATTSPAVRPPMTRPSSWGWV